MGTSGEGKKKSVADVIIDTILRQVDQNDELPWMNPYHKFNSFNYVTMRQYRGINRIILGSGEYLTMNQIRAINKKSGCDFFASSNTFVPVVFFNTKEYEVNRDNWDNLNSNVSYDDFLSKKGHAMYSGWYYYVEDGIIKKRKNTLVYHNVTERENIKTKDGKCLPTKVGIDAEVYYESPQRVIDWYLKRSGVKVTIESCNYSSYSTEDDTVYLNRHLKDKDFWYSTYFHELVHSTGTKGRLNRETFVNYETSEDLRAQEECIAEMTASMLCADCNLSSFNTSCSLSYANTIAYIQAWKKKIKDWGSTFIYLASEAEKAYAMIMGIQ